MKSSIAPSLFALAALALSAPSAVSAAECPVAEFDADKILAKISAAGNCGAAADVAESCAAGSSLDVQFVAAATKVCEKSFRKRVPRAEARTYAHLFELCAKKYEDMEGTMYISAAAFCQLSVVRAFESIFSPVE